MREVSCPICGKRMGLIESERYDAKGVPLPAWMCDGEHSSADIAQLYDGALYVKERGAE